MARADDLVGRWIHAHEEDDAECRVFRRPEYPLPPSRGRSELDVAPDLTVRLRGPGADDRPVAGGSARIGFTSSAEGEADYLQAVDVASDRLKIAKE